MLTLLSGWQDSNLRPPAPKAGAITGLRYTPMIVLLKALFILEKRNKFYSVNSNFKILKEQKNRSFKRAVQKYHLNLFCQTIFTLNQACPNLCNFDIDRLHIFVGQFAFICDHFYHRH